MVTFLKQSTAIDVSLGPFLDDTDGKTAETGLTITQPDIRLKKNGSAWAQKNAAQTLTHEENGWYEVALDTTDTNTVGNLLIAIHGSGALPCWREFQVLPANVYDSFIGGTDKLQVHADEITAGLITAAAIADNAIDAGAIATGAITAAKFGAGAIDAAAIATDAIDADALKADAITEIQSGLATSTQVDSLEASAAAIEADTQDIQSRLPAALVSGRIDASAGAISANAITASSMNADASTEIAAAVWAAVLETGFDASKAIRIIAAAVAGKVTGGPGSPVFRNLADTQDQITGTADSSGNRSAATYGS